jgi:hypothetical protein
MILHPGILALLVASGITCLIVVLSAMYGIRIVRSWDLQSGSAQQLRLERSTYLVSTFLSHAVGLQLISFFLFIFVVDRIHIYFTGAMCAAGVLNVNPYGYPALVLKLVNFLLSGLWLIMNAVDNQAPDYPLIRKKYLFLVLLAPLIIVETYVLGKFIAGLDPEVITSCCGSLFSLETKGLASELAALPRVPTEIAFFVTMGLSIALGLVVAFRGRGGCLFSLVSTAAFFVSIASLISFISLYIYELPSHHCPFDILQGEYGYIGYPLYLSLLGGGLAGMAVGAIMPFRKIPSLEKIVPAVQARLALVTVLLYSLFLLITVYWMLFSNFTLNG